jgi:hypothetical protein
MVKPSFFAEILLTSCVAAGLILSVQVNAQDSTPIVAPSSIAIEWLSARGIDQPVTSDQTRVDVIYTLDGKETHGFISAEADTSLWKNSDAALGDGNSILLRDGRYSEGLIKLDLGALPKGAQITSASFHFKVGPVENRGQPGVISCYRILTPWTEAATWHHPQPGSADWKGLQSGTDFVATPFSELPVASLDDKQTGGQILSIPHFEDALRQWQSGAWPDQGFLIAFNGKALQFSFASREAAGNGRDVILGGPTDGKLLVESNQALLTQLLIKPDDLLSAQPQINIEKAQPPLGPDAPGKLKIYAVEGADRDSSPNELLASLALKDLSTTTPTRLPDVSAQLRTWLASKADHTNLLLTLEDATAQLTIGGPTHPRAKPKLFLSIRSYPTAQLFTVPFAPRAGVYTQLVDGHLNYGGKRLRLWGVVGHPDVDRLANMGFNAERVWGPSGGLGEGKTYSVESAKRGEFQPSTKGDCSELDLADKHFADLKSHGMFVMLAALTQTIPYEPLYQDGSFISGGADWTQWKEAMQTPKAGNPYHYIFVDERLQKIKMQAAKNLLTHVNPYTGKAYGEEENIAVYEIYNENGFVFKMLSGELDKWPAYFQAKMQKKWNAWLVTRYTDDTGLKKAWGKCDDGESLAGGTIRPGPDFENRLKYPEARSNDYVHFMIDLENDYNQTFRSYCRSLFPAGVGVNVVPFSFDTMFRPNLPWAYTDCLGDVFSYGMYYWDLKSSLDKPPASYLIDSFTVEKKPTVLYETNIGRPDPFRAEYPIKLAALASYQDWDGVFWHYWSAVSGEGNLPYLTEILTPPMPTFYWTAVQHQTDPVMCTSMALAGRLFLGGYLPPAIAPRLFPIGAKSLFSYSAFRGINVAPSTFRQGSEIQFNPEDTSTAPDNLIPVSARLKNAIASGKYITWDWPNGRLIIDAPNIKAYVGKTDGMFRFSDGITLGDVSTPWVAFVLESSDGKPLIGSQSPTRMLMGAVADAKNSGFSFNYNVVGGPVDQAKAVHDLGHLPVLVDRVEYTVWFPRQFSGTLKAYDFALREARSTSIVKSNEVVQKGATPFVDSLDIQSWGEEGELPVADATKIDTDHSTSTSPAESVATSTGLKKSDLIHPIPGMDWSMDYPSARHYVENSPLPFTTFSDYDASSNPDKTLTVTDLQLSSFWNNAVDARVSFHYDQMTEVEIDLKEPPPVEDVITQFSALIGDPTEKKIDAQYGTTRIFWKSRHQTPAIIVTESQGVMKILYQGPVRSEK